MELTELDQPLKVEYTSYLIKTNLTAQVDPIWRTRNDIDKEIFATLEALYYYSSTEILSIEEAYTYADIINDVLGCKSISDLKNLELDDYLEPAFEKYMNIFNFLNKSSNKQHVQNT